jgi:acyl transferase domain-containing protein
MYEVADIFEEMLKFHMTGREADIPFYSSVTGKRATAKSRFGPAYWKSNLVQPVLFNSAVEAILDDLRHEVTFLEIGPHSVLQGPLRQILQGCSGKIPSYVPTLIRRDDCTVSMLTAVGRLYTHGHDIDFSFINPPSPVVTNLPNYPWDHSTEFWKESRISRAWRQRKYRYHELLGSRCLENSDTEPVWRNTVNVFDTQWLSDHKIVNDIVFPCAGYIAMIGEAIRQMTDSEVYTIRNLVIKTAMVLQESETTEIITTARPSRLTDSTNSSWYDFSISSFNGASWLQHCVAQGRPGEEHTIAPKSIAPYSRQLSECHWYERMRHMGLNYGPQFQGLKDISAHTKDTVAVAAIRSDMSKHQSKYSIHPTTIDFCLQLCTVAMSSGVARRLHTLAVPRTVGYLCVKPGGPNFLAEAEARINAKGTVQAQILAVAEMNEVVINFENVTFTPLDAGDEMENMDPVAVSQLEWRPDVDFLDMGELIKRGSNNREGTLLSDKFVVLYILRTLDALESLDTPPTGHLAKFVAWLRREKESMAREVSSQSCPEAQQWALLDAESRNSLLRSMAVELDALDNIVMSSINRLCQKLSDQDNLRDILTGALNPVQLMLEDGALADLYDISRGTVNTDEFFSLCSHAQPTLNVLEIGAGTGGATQDILKALLSKEGTRMYSQYTFTDISSGFFAAAEERFKEYTGLTYKVLDISKNPAEQGFDLGTYDLIIASNVCILSCIWPPETSANPFLQGPPCYSLPWRESAKRTLTSSYWWAVIPAGNGPT